MINDPIVDELDRLRAEQMACFNFDFEAFYQNLKDRQRLSPQPLQTPPEPTLNSSMRRVVGATVRR